MRDQMPHTHNTNQFILPQTMINQPVTEIPNRQEEENKIENENLSYTESMKTKVSYSSPILIMIATQS